MKRVRRVELGDGHAAARERRRELVEVVSSEGPIGFARRQVKQALVGTARAGRGK